MQNFSGLSGLGIRYENVKRKRRIVLGMTDSLVIRKGLRLDELERVLKKVSEVDKRDDNFALGYFIDAKKKGISSAELRQCLIEKFSRGEIKGFQLVGDDYLTYYKNAADYRLISTNNEIFYSSDDPIMLEEIFDVFQEEKKLSKHFIGEFLNKWKIETLDENGNEMLYPITIMDSMQGVLAYGNDAIPCYLIQGKWYCMDEKYMPKLKEQFIELYNDNYNRNLQIKQTFSLNKQGMTEDEYNKDFMKSGNVIVGHKALIGSYEIADLIFWDQENVYLMCNKMKFNGEGSRDLSNQILSSADYFIKQFNSANRPNFLHEWYNAIENNYNREKMAVPITDEDFRNAFTEKELIYIAGYMKGYKINTASPYAQYCTIDLVRRFKSQSLKIIVMGIE